MQPKHVRSISSAAAESAVTTISNSFDAIAQSTSTESVKGHISRLIIENEATLVRIKRRPYHRQVGSQSSIELETGIRSQMSITHFQTNVKNRTRGTHCATNRKCRKKSHTTQQFKGPEPRTDQTTPMVEESDEEPIYRKTRSAKQWHTEHPYHFWFTGVSGKPKKIFIQFITCL
ncbi:unnamed protein product [Onchocerca ochengi]|uniref:Uncharacterized protein n=1 Tax=Onchocerca ochengi TaxID=42157 RepID=A0A182EXT6_ONCOC|nr:unnamed protein product [Onchocerca ochengi]